MKRDEGMTLAYAQQMAEALVELLAPACERIEIAGSVRRGKARPNDVEIVAIPRWVYSEDYHESGAKANELDLRCDELLTQGTLGKRPDSGGRHCWGTGIRRAVFYQGQNYAPVDLFQVIEPRQWGVIYAIRTGPGDLTAAGDKPVVRWGLPEGPEGGRWPGVVHRPRAGGPGQDASDEVRPPGRARRDRGNDDPHAGGGGLLPCAGCTLLASTRADGGSPPLCSMYLPDP